jgi:uncharacterized protein
MGRATRLGLIGLVVVVVLGAVGLGAGGWIYSDELLPAPPPFTPSLDVVVLDADEATSRVELAVTGGDLVDLQTVGLVTGDGLLVLEGDAIPSAEGFVRTGVLVEGTWPAAGDRVGASVDTYFGTPSDTLGIPFETVQVPSPDGTLPGWRIVPNGATTDTWVVIVHGRGGGLSEGNRLLPTLDRLGLPTLTISVRNDLDAPADPDGFGYYGDREWQDLAAAVDHLVATEQAERIVLVGYSQGASIALSYLRRSPDAELVAGAVLISPLISLHETLTLQAQLRDIPDPVIPALLTATRAISAARSGLDFEQVEHLEWAGELPDDVPMLVTHGSDDAFVPIGPSRAFDAALGEQVVYEEYPGADHVREWNVDRERFESDLAEFLTGELAVTD